MIIFYICLGLITFCEGIMVRFKIVLEIVKGFIKKTKIFEKEKKKKVKGEDKLIDT